MPLRKLPKRDPAKLRNRPVLLVSDRQAAIEQTTYRLRSLTSVLRITIDASDGAIGDITTLIPAAALFVLTELETELTNFEGQLTATANDPAND